MKLSLCILTLALLAVPSFSQQPAHPQPEAAPAADSGQLSYLEVVALQATAADIRKAQAEQQDAVSQLRRIEAEIHRNHPGYLFDESKMALVRDTPAAQRVQHGAPAHPAAPPATNPAKK